MPKKVLSPPLRMVQVAELLGWVDESSTERQLRAARLRALRMLRRIEKQRGCRLLHPRKNAGRKIWAYYTTAALLQKHCGELIDVKSYVDRQVAERVEKFKQRHRERIAALEAAFRTLRRRLEEVEKKCLT